MGQPAVGPPNLQPQYLLQSLLADQVQGASELELMVPWEKKSHVSYDLNLLLAEKMAEVFFITVLWIGSQHPLYDGPVNLSSQVCKPVAESSCSSKSECWPYRPPYTDS